MEREAKVMAKGKLATERKIHARMEAGPAITAVSPGRTSIPDPRTELAYKATAFLSLIGPPPLKDVSSTKTHFEGGINHFVEILRFKNTVPTNCLNWLLVTVNK